MVGFMCLSPYESLSLLFIYLGNDEEVVKDEKKDMEDKVMNERSEEVRRDFTVV